MKLNINARPQGRNTVSQGFSITPEHNKMIEALAKHYGCNKSQVIQQCIVQAHAALPKSKRIKTT